MPSCVVCCICWAGFVFAQGQRSRAAWALVFRDPILCMHYHARFFLSFVRCSLAHVVGWAALVVLSSERMQGREVRLCWHTHKPPVVQGGRTALSNLCPVSGVSVREGGHSTPQWMSQKCLTMKPS
ncbi:hypothetical protein DUNSADRAFT_11754 [Dunaliella salina]|uniref:Secreted protein n=1 Tax=Dunaliella salina TaxID=3046 RepID=A0ABQ7GCP8_DUNSA|nr:hypothetical protein DUNSADRAFT_11754 [Dunaliella salina]|eukprot:KAF5832382.1 hypothetical protein DUNSADRAFT_11754 [Dunaliella salina]